MTGQRLALLVAADEFSDPGLASLRAPQVDVESLASVFEDSDIGGFTVERLVNCTSQEFRLAVNRVFAHRDPDDFVLVHVSSHGLKDATGDLFLATTDTRREHLDATSVEATYLRRQMDRSRAKAAVLLLDCCYGGAFERGMVTRSAGSVDLAHAFVAENEGRGRAVITASTAIEYAFEGAELTADQPAAASVFSDAIVKGLAQGAADLDGDGLVSLGELFTFVSRRVRDQSAGQTPQWWLYGMSEELVIARNPNPGIKAIELPADVTDVLAFPQPAARLGAILALRELVHGTPGLALTAYQTLQTLALDDSRLVSSAATEALSDVHITVEPEVLDFGQLAAGATAPVMDLVLSGSLARAAELVVVDAPLAISRRGNHARVSLDTTNIGPVDGRIEVRGPGGGVSVEVRGQVGPSSTRSTPPPTRTARWPVHRRPSPPVPARSVSTDSSSTRSERRPQMTTLLLLGWVIAGMLTIGALLPIDLSSSIRWKFENTWFGNAHTILPVLAIPIPLLGVQLSRDLGTRLAFAGALAGAGLQPALAGIETMTKRGIYLTPVVLVVLCGGLIVVAGLVVQRLVRDLPRGERRLRVPVAAVTMAALIGCGYLYASLDLTYAFNVHLTNYLLCGLLGAIFLVPLPASIRVLQCGVALGSTLSAALYLSEMFVSTSYPAFHTTMLVNLIFAVVALINLWPAWSGLPARTAADR